MPKFIFIRLVKRPKHWLFLFAVWVIFGLNSASAKDESVAIQNNLTKDNIHITLHTTAGDITIELFAKQAPLTTANFMRYVKSGAFNQGEIYRVVRENNDNGSPKISVIQGGPNPDFNDFMPISLETTAQTGITHLDGTLSMARGEPNTATSAFFICVGDQPSLDFGGQRNPDTQGFAAFGKVIQGMGIVRKINQMTDTKEVEDTYMQGQILRQPIVIQSISLP